MSPYYKKKYKNTYSRSRTRSYLKAKSYYPEVEIGPKKTFDITTYIKTEFFNADDIMFLRIANMYKQLYGYSAYQYLIDTFNSWRSGQVKLSGQTMRRILECVPKFLSDEKRFYILKCELTYFIEILHSKNQNKSISLNELNALFEDYAQQINSFNEVNLTWFVGKGIFSQNEISQFLSVCKYALSHKLRLAYTQVHSDISFIKQKLSGLKTGIFGCEYAVDFLNSKVDLSKINEFSIDKIEFNTQRIVLEGVFKQFAEKYILEEFMKIEFVERQGQINSLLKSQDLEFFITQYEEILTKDQEVSMKSEFKGGGGVVRLSLEAKPLKTIRKLILTSASKLLLLALLFIGTIGLVFQFGLYKHGWLAFWGVLIVEWFFIVAIANEIKGLKKLNLDIKTYGK